MTGGRVLLIDDDADIRSSVGQSLELGGFDVTALARADLALDLIGPDFDGVVVSDIRMPRMDGMAFLDAALDRDRDICVILITGHGDVPLAVKALDRGAYDFIEKPFPRERLTTAIARAMDKRRMTQELRRLRMTTAQGPLDRHVLGTGPQIQDLRRRIATVAGSRLDVLVVGDTGTGKEHVARAIHDASDRAAGPFVVISLAALQSDKAAADLFGHTAHAFPGTTRARTGRLEHGRGGTIYLDDIGSAPLDVQAQLLRLFEDRAITPLGAPDPVDLDARFVASSRHSLEDLVARGLFREDLLYRINALTLRLPPLADRAAELPYLFSTFVDMAAADLDRPRPDVPPEALLRLATRDWPGNLRELRSAAERFVLGLDREDLGGGETLTLPQRVERFERDAIVAALRLNDGSLKATYESLGLARKTLYEKMQKYGIDRNDG